MTVKFITSSLVATRPWFELPRNNAAQMGMEIQVVVWGYSNVTFYIITSLSFKRMVVQFQQQNGTLLLEVMASCTNSTVEMAYEMWKTYLIPLGIYITISINEDCKWVSMFGVFFCSILCESLDTCKAFKSINLVKVLCDFLLVVSLNLIMGTLLTFWSTFHSTSKK